MKPLITFGIVSSALILLAAALGQNVSYRPDPDWRAPDEAAARPNPLAHKSQAVAGGKKLFLRNCAECHNKDGSGIVRKHAADLQLAVVQTQSDGTLFWKITNGNPDRGMPSFSKLPELERWQVVLYLRTLKPPESHAEKNSESCLMDDCKGRGASKGENQPLHFIVKSTKKPWITSEDGLSWPTRK